MRALSIGLTLMLTVAVAAAGPKGKVQKAKHVPGAMVIVIDKSGSMQGPKLESTKAAILATVDALAPDDQVAVVVFDSEATVMVQLQRAANRTRIAAEVQRLQSGGGTNIFPGLQDAFSVLSTSKLARRHVLLLSDGEAPRDGIPELIKDMRAAKITVSTVAVDGADEKLLQDISTQGGGRAYKVTELGTLAPTFVKETRVALN